MGSCTQINSYGKGPCRCADRVHLSWKVEGSSPTCVFWQKKYSQLKLINIQNNSCHNPFLGYSQNSFFFQPKKKEWNTTRVVLNDTVLLLLPLRKQIFLFFFTRLPSFSLLAKPWQNSRPLPATRWKNKGDKPCGQLPSGRLATLLPFVPWLDRGSNSLSPFFPYKYQQREKSKREVEIERKTEREGMKNRERWEEQRREFGEERDFWKQNRGRNRDQRGEEEPFLVANHRLPSTIRNTTIVNNNKNRRRKREEREKENQGRSIREREEEEPSQWPPSFRHQHRY